MEIKLNIIIKFNSNPHNKWETYSAYIEGHEAWKGWGESQHAALGDLLQRHQQLFKIESIKYT